ncbi:MAG: flagellar protein [Blautia sp.]|nr:flagellar protein [Muribaculaceae bacterium]MCM1144245.1 flagellar protein [Lachnoclostridium sp.]MCM1211703.1 flagellar protein [Blautia sp.]
MNVRNCKKCGQIFNYVSGPPICMSCREKMEEKFQEVKKYIQENRHATIPQVSEACEVSTNQIQQWLREERLELAEGSAIVLYCENCEAPILSGRFCEKCKNSMANKLSSSIKKPEAPKPQKKKDPKENPKMRFLN